MLEDDEQPRGVKTSEAWLKLAHHYETDTYVQYDERSTLRIPAYSHDFVIPSLSQAVGPLLEEDRPVELTADQKKYFLGNKLNVDATHISGASTDIEFAKKLLTELGRRLPSSTKTSKL